MSSARSSSARSARSSPAKKVMAEEYVFPESIFYLNGDFSSNKNHDRYKEFKFVGSGVYGVVYGNEEIRRVIKIMTVNNSGKFTTEKYDEEVDKQKKASDFDIAPKIYNSGITKSASLNNGDDFYYIEMDYLSERYGWEYVHSQDRDKINDLFCNFINTLIDDADLCNKHDPEGHFYYNKQLNKIYMIDYGNVDYCDNIKCKSDCKKIMFKKLELKCEDKPSTDVLHRTLKRKESFKSLRSIRSNKKGKNIKVESIKSGGRKFKKGKYVKRRTIKKRRN